MVRRLLLAAFAALVCPAALPQGNPLRIIVPVAPGVPSDVLSRGLIDPLSRPGSLPRHEAARGLNLRAGVILVSSLERSPDERTRR